MKRIYVDFETMISVANCKKAIWKASEKKRDRDNVKLYVDPQNIDHYAQELHDMLKNDIFSPSPYILAERRDSSSGKVRKICKPQFWPDQCVHWVLIQAFQSAFMRGMYHWSCGSIPGRGTHFGKRAIERWINNDRKNTKYVFQMDIRHCYENIRGDMLKQAVLHKVKGGRAIMLLFHIIDSWPEGLPLGNYTSQWLANFFLEPFDHFLKEQLHVKYFVRYVDDVVVFGPSKKELHKVEKQVIEYLAKKYRLEVKPNHQVYKLDARAVDVLGYRFFRKYTILRKRNAQAIRKQTRRIAKKKKQGKKPTFHEAAGLLSRIGQLKHCDHKNFWDRNVRPFVNIKELKGVVRNESQKRQKTAGNGGRNPGQRERARVPA